MMEKWLELDNGMAFLNMANCDAVTFDHNQSGELVAYVSFGNGHVKRVEGVDAEKIMNYLFYNRR